MGSPIGEKDRLAEEVPREVTIPRPFYMGKYPITQEQYQAVMGKNPGNFRKSGPRQNRLQGQETARFPVEMVSWNDAQEFLRRLQSHGFNLPDAEQWEYCCRAGTITTFHTGRILTSREAQYDDGTLPFNRPSSVGSYSANAFGLYDMHGNVWEWCADEYIPSNGARYIARGGSWDSLAWHCRSVYCSHFAVELWKPNLGFRVCMAINY